MGVLPFIDWSMEEGEQHNSIIFEHEMALLRHKLQAVPRDQSQLLQEAVSLSNNLIEDRE